MAQVKKKVLFTSHTANFSKFNRPFMRWFKDQGYEVHYASMGEEQVLDCDKHFTVPFTRSPFKLSNIAAYRQLKKIIDAEGYDIIHTHTPMGSVVTRLAAKTARKNGTRVIYTAHGFHFFTGAPLLNWLIYYPVEKFMARHTDTLITINKEDYERAKRKFSTDVRYVPGVGIDPKKFDFKMSKAEKLKLRKSLGLKEDDFVMIYPAELSKRKNQLWLIDALAGLINKDRSVHLLLPGGDSLNGECQREAARFGLEKNIHFLGYRNDIPQLMMMSDIAVSSSLQEGLPVNLLEAIAVGLPIVASDCRGNRDLISLANRGVIVDKNSINGFIEAIEELRDAEETDHTESIQPYLLPEIMKNMKKLYLPKPRVLHLLASNKFSGAENVACSIIDATKNKYESIYCSPLGIIDEVLDVKNIDKLNIRKLSYSELNRVITTWKPDIIHAHDFRASILASFFSKKTRVISHIHQNPEWMNKLNLKSLLYKSRTHTFDKIVTVTSVMRTNYVFDKVPPNAMVTLYNFIDTSHIYELAREPHEEKYDLVFCGRLESVKQPLEFLKIVKALKKRKPNIQAVVIGEGSLFNECEVYIKENGLSENIKMVGFQRNPYKYIKNSRCLVLTSQDEGFGLVAAEAAILGISVASYDLPAVRELITGGIFGDVQQLIDDIGKVLRDASVFEPPNVREEVIDSKAWSSQLQRIYERRHS